MGCCCFPCSVNGRPTCHIAAPPPTLFAERNCWSYNYLWQETWWTTPAMRADSHSGPLSLLLWLISSFLLFGRCSALAAFSLALSFSNFLFPECFPPLCAGKALSSSSLLQLFTVHDSKESDHSKLPNCLTLLVTSHRANTFGFCLLWGRLWKLCGLLNRAKIKIAIYLLLIVNVFHISKCIS